MDQIFLLIKCRNANNSSSSATTFCRENELISMYCPLTVKDGLPEDDRPPLGG